MRDVTLIDLAEALSHCARTICRVLLDLADVLRFATKSRSALVAENLFLRKQLALFQERNVRPHRAEDAARWLMACLSQLFDWRGALVVVKPDTLIPGASPRVPLVLALESAAARLHRQYRLPPVLRHKVFSCGQDAYNRHICARR